MWLKVIFGHPKWPPAAILWKKIQKIKVAYWSEMSRNAIESDFWSSKMAAGSHFVKKSQTKKLSIDLKWREMRSKFIFGHPKWGGGGGGITMASLWTIWGYTQYATAHYVPLGKYTNSSWSLYCPPPWRRHWACWGGHRNAGRACVCHKAC